MTTITTSGDTSRRPSAWEAVILSGRSGGIRPADDLLDEVSREELPEDRPEPRHERAWAERIREVEGQPPAGGPDRSPIRAAQPQEVREPTLTTSRRSATPVEIHRGYPLPMRRDLPEDE